VLASIKLSDGRYKTSMRLSPGLSSLRPS